MIRMMFPGAPGGGAWTWKEVSVGAGRCSEGV